ncbi:MAG: hypothetical protein AB8G22_11015 [Saprospiraceae bacterium]
MKSQILTVLLFLVMIISSCMEKVAEEISEETFSLTYQLDETDKKEQMQAELYEDGTLVLISPTLHFELSELRETTFSSGNRGERS